METNLHHTATWATLDIVDLNSRIVIEQQIHEAFEALINQKAALGMAVFSTTPSAGGPATYYFSPADGILSKAFQAVPTDIGPGASGRVFVCGDDAYAAKILGTKQD